MNKKSKNTLKVFALFLGIYALVKQLKNKSQVRASTQAGFTTPTNKEAILIIINGESNAGGMALNSDLSESEKQPFSNVFIYNADNNEFQTLQIGLNNNTGHEGLSSQIMHGFELGIALSVRNGEISTPVYIVKTAQGGSIIDQWATSGVYFSKMQNRINYALNFFTREGIAVKNSFLVYNQGINDAYNSGITQSLWKQKTAAHFASIRAILGVIPILFVNLIETPETVAYNNSINEFSNELSKLYIIDSTNAGLQNANHWNASGMKLISSRIVEKIRNLIV